MLIELKKALDDLQVELHFAEMKDPVKDKLKRFELFPILGADIFYPTIGAAVDHYLVKYKIEWKP